MGFKLAEAFVEITGNKMPLDNTLARSRNELGRFVADGNRQLAGLGKGMKLPSLGAMGGLGSVAAAAGASIGFATVTSELFDATRKAMDLGETLSKLDATFGPSAKTIIDLADDMAAKFGLVRTEIMDAASSFGLVLQASGKTKAEAAATSVILTKLAADYSSLFNVSLAEAITRINSGLVGEAEPMRRFGVLLSETAVKAEAMRMGLGKANGELDEATKVSARVSLILKGSATAMGDLERTADSAANQMRKFWGDIENAKVDFGKMLIDPLLEAIKLARELGTAFGDVTKSGAGEGASGWMTALIRTLRDAHANGGLIGHAGLIKGMLDPEARQNRLDKLAGVQKADTPEQIAAKAAAAKKKAKDDADAKEETRRAGLTFSERFDEDRAKAARDAAAADAAKGPMGMGRMEMERREAEEKAKKAADDVKAFTSPFHGMFPEADTDPKTGKVAKFFEKGGIGEKLAENARKRAAASAASGLRGLSNVADAFSADGKKALPAQMALNPFLGGAFFQVSGSSMSSDRADGAQPLSWRRGWDAGAGRNRRNASAQPGGAG